MTRAAASPTTSTIDTLGLCLFPSLACLDIPDLQGLLRAATAAVTGEELPDDYLMTLGAKVVVGEREFNKRAGFTTADDRLPAFMTVEALPPSGNVFDVSDADLDSVFAQ
ncbi:MAG: aldehyde ferredoxin oxidoreductase C-terminal domain-containing protein [Actinobacteria bacterium]|nr:aldehyde ferredoxin oxidoreductase C-terminal domain-containing protein [Actinomycetota bacterium]